MLYTYGIWRYLHPWYLPRPKTALAACKYQNSSKAHQLNWASRSHRSSPLPPTHLARPLIPIPPMPLVNLPPHALPVRLVLFARLDQQLRAVARAAQVALEVLPAAVGLERAVCEGAAVRAERLPSITSVSGYRLIWFCGGGDLPGASSRAWTGCSSPRT